MTTEEIREMIRTARVERGYDDEYSFFNGDQLLAVADPRQGIVLIESEELRDTDARQIIHEAAQEADDAYWEWKRRTNLAGQKMKTLSIIQNGFHGSITVPVTGTNWRRWNIDTVAVNMTADAVATMNAAATSACAGGDCECGGYYTAEPIPGTPLNGAGTYLVNVTWITPEDEVIIGVDLSDLREEVDFHLPAVPMDDARVTNINVRASEQTMTLLRRIAASTGHSQADVVHIALQYLARNS